MLNVSFFTFNAFEENTYIITNEQKQCWIVDPGMYDKREIEQFISYIRDKQLKPQAIINTHAHLDHIFGVNDLVREYDIQFGIHELDVPMLQLSANSASMFGFEFNNPPRQDFFIKEGTLQLGNDTVAVMHTPGHSTGSISFYYAPGNWVISGDVLFSGGIGRTDLPGGDFDTLISSIRNKLFLLPDNTKVLSGHGPATSIAEEKKHNPFLQ